ncbi:hypothetical protein [Limnoglobus roseus]|uniref:Uncharacterized protein n=1 Tax=Limnoglobus roseus TaxID=2598579 RepID=A0A5C1AJG7_9BACT|nr:hypothetical protein [Limnoglobus roseus]QEL19341.1 hypothetical protein PX52LOC_06410 [Limnoglobus roseus]
MTTIQPITQTQQLVEQNATVTVEFKRYLDQLLERVGGTKGGSYVGLTEDAIVIWDVDKKPTAYLLLTGNRSMADPVNMVPGMPILRLTIVQDGVGGHTLSWGPSYKFPSGLAPSLSAGGNAVDELWFSTDGTNMKLITGAKDLR